MTPIDENKRIFQRCLQVKRGIDAIIFGKKRRKLKQPWSAFPIIEAILFCGRKIMPLRGHRNDGLLDLTVFS